MGRYIVYFLLKDMKPVYIGHTKHKVTRILCHKNKDHNAVRVMYCKDKASALYYEKRWIRRFKPVCNKNGVKVSPPNNKHKKHKGYGEPVLKYKMKTVRVSFSVSKEIFEKAQIYANEQDRTIGNYISYAINRAVRNDTFFIEKTLEEPKLRIAK